MTGFKLIWTKWANKVSQAKPEQTKIIKWPTESPGTFYTTFSSHPQFDAAASFLPPSVVLLLLRLARVLSLHHLEISQKHPVQMAEPPLVATVDAKKLQLINQICVIKSLFFCLITHLQLMITNYRECVLVAQEMLTKTIQHRNNSKPSHVTHYHPSVALWWLLSVLTQRWKNVIFKIYANSRRKN